MFTLDLRQAFREAGCPICRLRAKMDGRHLYNLLYENVTDGTTRMHIARSKGLCQEHAWELQAIEQEHWGNGLGVGIIYEDLASHVVGTLSAYLAANPEPRAARQARLRERLERSGFIRQWLGRRLLRPSPADSLLESLAAVEPCRVCELIGGLVEIKVGWLVEELADPEFLALYAASDGLCLPHLRRALALARDEEAVRWLAEVALNRLAPLAADAAEYVRKIDWSNRHEPKHPWEQVSWVRAVAFFSGEARAERKADVYELRRTALAEYHTRSKDMRPSCEGVYDTHCPGASWPDGMESSGALSRAGGRAAGRDRPCPG